MKPHTLLPGHGHANESAPMNVTSINSTQAEALWTTADIATFTRLHLRTVQSMASRGALPTPLPNFGRVLRWEPATIRAFFGVSVAA